MTLARSALTVFFLLLSALCIGPLSAQAQGQGTFRFGVCNKSPYAAAVAIGHHPSASDEGFVVEGWWAIDAGKCGLVGSFPQGWFYYFAIGLDANGKPAKVWGGDTKVCVPLDKFSRTVTANYKCQSNEVLVGFGGAQVTEDSVWTIQ